MGSRLGWTTPKKALEYARQILRRNPTTCVLHFELNVISQHPLGDSDRAGKGELECIGQKVENNLLPLVPIDVHRFRDRVAPDRQYDTCALECRTEHTREVSGQ